MDLNCTNILFIGGIKNKVEMEKINSLINEKLKCFYVDENIGWMEIGFFSEKVFPETKVKEVVERFGTPMIQLGIISYAFYENYVEYNLYKDGQWTKPITSKML